VRGHAYEVGNTPGVVAQADIADGLRDAGFRDMEIEAPFTLPGGGKTDADLVGTDANGVRRVIEAKNDQMLDREQEKILKEMASQLGAVPTVVSNVGLTLAQLRALQRAGVDVIDKNGNLLN
jgi:hypothetical protein